MRITESFRVALDALRANRLRSLLTMLGVVIGVAAVVVLVAIGGGAKQLVTSEVEGLGSNIVFVAPGKFQLGTSPAISRPCSARKLPFNTASALPAATDIPKPNNAARG